MAAYMVALGKINDQAEFAKYVEAVVPTLGPFGAKPVVIQEPAEVLEGDTEFDRVVVVEFASVDDIKAWKASDAYQAIVHHRLNSSVHVLYGVPGFVMPD